jgi:phenylalanyl-tRNA synthetase beta chain
MKVSLAWLRELVAWPDDAAALAERLTLAGLAVDGVEPVREDLAPIVVGEVLETRRHPNADRLTLCRVRIGSGDPLAIVCGAPNVRPGIRVAVGLVGTTLPNGLTLEPRTIRGETSHGMILSGDELACDPTPEGIWILPDDAPVGASLRPTLGLDDAVLDIDVPSNRGDCLSHIGIAREVAAWSGAALALPAAYGAPRASGVDSGAGARAGVGGVPIAIDDPDACPSYGAARLFGVRVGPSPDWLRRRLERLGVRSVSNVVDVTNLVLLECGQPVHAFDLARLDGPELRVRRARPGERLATLDEKEQALPPQVLVIADRRAAIAIAGIVGGKDSEVTAQTREILVEVAHFDAAVVRAGARALRKTTEASLRFGRGVDGAGVAAALERAVELLAQVAGAERVAARVLRAAPEPAADRSIRFAPDDARRLVGIAPSDDEVAQILTRLSCRVEREAGGAWRVLPPTYRRDLVEPVDLIEEVARLHGYDRIPEREAATTRGAVRSERAKAEARLRALLADLGFFEVRTLSLVDPAELARLRVAGEGVVAVENPLSTEQSVLRPSLVPGLLGCLRLNWNRGNRDVRLFETGVVFEQGTDAGAADAGGAAGEASRGAVGERRRLALAWCGARRTAAWDAPAEPADLFDLKGAIETTADAAGAPTIRCAEPRAPRALCHPARQASLVAGGDEVGFLGEIDRDVAEAAGLPEGTLIAEIELDRVLAPAGTVARHAPLPRFPSIRRDVALVVDAAIPEGRVRDAVAEAAGPRLESLALFDVYRGDQVPAGKKSLAYALVFRAPDGTLADADADALRDAVVAALAREVGASVR